MKSLAQSNFLTVVFSEAEGRRWSSKSNEWKLNSLCSMKIKYSIVVI